MPLERKRVLIHTTSKSLKLGRGGGASGLLGYHCMYRLVVIQANNQHEGISKFVSLISQADNACRLSNFDTYFNLTRVKTLKCCHGAKHEPSNFIHSHLMPVSLHRILSSNVVAVAVAPFRLLTLSPTPGYQSSRDFQCPRQTRCLPTMTSCTTTNKHAAQPHPELTPSFLTSLLNYSSTISAVQSLRISSSDRSAVFSITRPFSLAKCSRQMKQYDVEISSITGLGYTDCRLFMTEVNLRGSSWFASAGFYNQALLVWCPSC